MFDIFNGSHGKGSSNPFIIGRVKKVVLGENLLDGTPNPNYNSEKSMGAVYFEALYSNKSEIKGDSAYSKPAYPIFSFIRQYPNIGEIVLIFPGPSSDLNDGKDKQDLWYFPTFAIWNSVHHNVFPDMSEYSDFLNSKLSKPGYDSKSKDYPNIPQGYTFTERDNIKSLRPFEGDTILQGRWGQSMRFGSTVSGLKSINPWSQTGIDGDPITMIVNSQKEFTNREIQSPVTVEDINRDGSSIYLTAGQKISMVDLNLFPNRSYSQGRSADPQVQEVIKVEEVAYSNDYVSPSDQDKNA
jgi:hypothetical protein